LKVTYEDKTYPLDLYMKVEASEDQVRFVSYELGSAVIITLTSMEALRLADQIRENCK